VSEHVSYTVQTVVFTPDGVVIEFTASTDVRGGGHLMLQRQLHLHAGHPDYREDIEDLQYRAVKALKNALEDFETSDPYTPEDDDEDEKGMGE